MTGKKLRRLWKEEGGSSAALIAVCMVVLLGFTAMAVDYGIMASHRQSLRNAADAAALAGAVELRDGHRGQVETTVWDYCRENGYDPTDTNVTVSTVIDGGSVTVHIAREVPMGFSQVLSGLLTRTVSAEATAAAKSILADYPYAMLAGRKIEDNGTGIAVIGNDTLRITGNIHSNADIDMHRAVLEDGSVATAVRNVLPSTSGWYGHSAVVEMPPEDVFMNFVENNAGVVTYTQSVYKNGRSCFSEFLEDSIRMYQAQYGHGEDFSRHGLFIHVKGDLIFNGYNPVDFTLTYPVMLLVDGAVQLNGAPMEGTLDWPVYVMSKQGNITIMGGMVTFAGLMYAPHGDVIFSGINVEYQGSIIAQNITKSGGSLVIRYASQIDRFLPGNGVHLIH